MQGYRRMYRLFSVYLIGVEMIQTFLPYSCVYVRETDWIVRV